MNINSIAIGIHTKGCFKRTFKVGQTGRRIVFKCQKFCLHIGGKIDKTVRAHPQKRQICRQVGTGIFTADILQRVLKCSDDAVNIKIGQTRDIFARQTAQINGRCQVLQIADGGKLIHRDRDIANRNIIQNIAGNIDIGKCQLCVGLIPVTRTEMDIRNSSTRSCFNDVPGGNWADFLAFRIGKAVMNRHNGIQRNRTRAIRRKVDQADTAGGIQVGNRHVDMNGSIQILKAKMF